MNDIPTIGRNVPAKSAVLVLGTAQLGLAYGAANRIGLPPEDRAIALIRAAARAGVHAIDTARAYGDSERRIGLALAEPGLADVAVVTKVDPLTGLRASVPAEQAVQAVRASLAASREALRRDRLDTLLLHRAAHRTEWAGAIWDLLRTERDTGRIGRLGVSVQSPAEALAALEDTDVQTIQLPYNLLDWRWDESGVIDALRRRSEVAVHARSALLQGLLVGSTQVRWPAIPSVAGSDVIALVSELARDRGRISLIDLCIAFVRAQGWIDGVVIGMETMEQLLANLELFNRPPLGRADNDLVLRRLPRLPEDLLDPAKWPRRPVVV